MIIKLDKHTCADFISQWVTDVDIDIVKAGCAGSKITVTPHIDNEERIFSETHDGIRCCVKAEFAEKLDGAQIARAKGRYYLVSKKIASRCGCGTSFSFEKKTVSKDLAKIHRIRNALRSSPDVESLRNIVARKISQ